MVRSLVDLEKPSFVSIDKFALKSPDSVTKPCLVTIPRITISLGGQRRPLRSVRGPFLNMVEGYYHLHTP